MSALPPIVVEDLERIRLDFVERDRLRGARILITGCGGFLGYYFMQFFAMYARALGIRRVVGVDNFLTGKPLWVERLAAESGGAVRFLMADVVNDDLATIPEI